MADHSVRGTVTDSTAYSGGGGLIVVRVEGYNVPDPGKTVAVAWGRPRRVTRKR